MEYENLKIEIEGEEVDELYEDLISLEVDLDDELANMFKIQIPLLQQADGTWKYLDDERFRVWRRVAIAAGFESGIEKLISGYITHMRPVFNTEPNDCYLEIWGMDGSVLMDREEQLKEWTNKKDSDIVSEIFSKYGFSPEVEDTEVIHDEAVSTIIQRETDMQFLKRLALRNGYECYVDGSNGHFHKPRISQAPQPLLAVHFGDETNVNHISFRVNGLTPADVEMFQIDRNNKEILDTAIGSSRQPLLGGTGYDDIPGAGIRKGKVYIGMNTVTSHLEMTSLCEGFFHKAEWFVLAEGEIPANLYGHVLKVRGTVTIKGVGETYSGVYYVTHVSHLFGASGYIQIFSAKRNAIMPDGSENFSSTGRTGGLI
jgi:phage protein D